MIKNKKANLNKKAEAVSFMGGRVVNMIIAAIVIILLIIFIAKGVVFYWFKGKPNDLAKTNDQLEIIKVKLLKAKVSGEEEKAIITPVVGWYLRTFPDFDFPRHNNCRTSVSCLCMCKSLSCDSEFVACEGFNFFVKVGYGLSISTPSEVPGQDYSGYIDEVIQLNKAIETLKIYKDGETVKIKRKS